MFYFCVTKGELLVSILSVEELEKYRESGNIAAQVMRRAKKIITKGRKLLYICDTLENEIRKFGAEPAFPLNVSVNQIAAHYTSPIADELSLPERSIVKIDLGARVDGYISDHAKTFLVGGTKTYLKLKKGAELALEKAIDFIKPGVRPGEIGEVIENTIRKNNLTPITDLSGHVIEQWKLHTGTSIPNSKPRLGFLGPKLKVGQVVAIEPFVTTSDGSEKIYDESYSYIFSQLGTKAKSKDAKKIIEKIEAYNGLPFALRWLEGLLPETKLFSALKELISYNSINRYPMLVSKSQTPVAQAEHTIIITESGCEIITQID
ncbi:MAG: type II methionyl aminopeptidase [Candidatus Heimdallarchaeota archaeon]|nr:type II methionyl aminopeptidase [Candidatus Heimdallarchaeota archaeon]